MCKSYLCPTLFGVFCEISSVTMPASFLLRLAKSTQKSPPLRPRNFKERALTWLRDHPQNYDLGENESHLAMKVDGDYEAIREYHRAMGCICYENHEMGLYFINDPDDYWIEILKADK